MSNVAFTWANLPLGYCWTGPQKYMDDIFALLNGSVPGGGTILIQEDLPGPDQQTDTVWVRTQGGLMEGIYLYQGVWHRPHPTPPSSPTRIIWTGSEEDLKSYDGGDGTSDPPTATTGAMWERDTAFDFRFPIGIGTNPTAYSPDAATVIAQGDTGGEEKHVLTDDELPAHAHTMFTDEAVNITAQPDSTEWAVVKGETPSGGDKEYEIQKGTVEPTKGITGEVGDDKAHGNMPPYVGVIFAKRTARQFYTALV